MKFFTSKIVTKQVKLEDAIAHAKALPPEKSLDEVLADLDAKNKGLVKVATKVEPKPAEAKVEPKPAEAKVEPKPAEAKVEPKAEKTAAAAPATVKVAEVPEAFKEHQFKAKGDKEDGEKKEDKKEDKKDDKPDFLKDKGEKKEDKKEKEEECAKCADSKPFALKIAKSLDFRQWAAEDVVLAWSQHGNHDQCMKNVQGLVSDPKIYCALLRTASSEASKFVKTAAPEQKEEKVAEKQPATFKKIAKLTDKERSWLAKYYGELYGTEYVDALLADY